MKRVFAISVITGLLGIANSAFAVDQAAVDKEFAAAKVVATRPGGEDLTDPAWLCDFSHRPGGLRAGPDPQPSKAFDNLYYVGTGQVASWAITTSAGIILIDTLDNPQEANQFIIGGLKKLGLDPNSIKYIIITHEHGDHFGGGRTLQNAIPGVHTLMSAAAWNSLASADPRFLKPGGPTPPTKDMTITDGEKLTLGDETVTLYLTPGHTPGTISALIPVKDHGVSHTLALWGGIPFAEGAEAQFMASQTRFRRIMAANHVEGRISNHPLWSNTLHKLDKLKADPQGPNPFLESPDDMARYAKIQDICLKAQHIIRSDS